MAASRGRVLRGKIPVFITERSKDMFFYPTYLQNNPSITDNPPNILTDRCRKQFDGSQMRGELKEVGEKEEMIKK